MKCSNCSREVKPIVAVDIDGTLADYHSHFLRFATSWLGRTPDLPVYDGTDPFSMWCAMAFDISIDTYRQIKLAYRQGGMKRTMPIFDGARALCWSIRDAGAELWVTTTRPYLSLDNIVPDTVEWLRRHEIEYDGMLFDEDKYEQLANRVSLGRVVAIFDDLTEMCLSASAIFTPDIAWLVRGRYNSKCRALSMCDLDSACDIALAAINRWKEEYHG